MILLKGWFVINLCKDKKKDVWNEIFILFEYEFLNGVVYL